MPNEPVNLLLVDDDPLTLKSLRLLFVKSGYEVVTATDGAMAKSLIENKGTKAFDCLLTDFRMPEMTGLELIAWLSGFDNKLSSILITAEGDKTLIASALRGGVSDFIEKPYHFNIVREAVDKAVARTRQNREMASTVDQVRAITELHDRLNFVHTEEVGVGGERSKMVLVIRMHPIRETGGDFINSYPMGKSRFCVVMGDVSGHDLKAGFISAYFQGMVRGMIDADVGMRDVCKNFNQHLIKDWNQPRSPEERSVLKTSLASTILMLDMENSSLELYNHGLPPPLFHDGCAGLSVLGAGGPPLGWFSDISYNPLTHKLPPCGHVYLWSDGLEDFAEGLGITPVTLASRLVAEENVVERERLLLNRTDDILVSCVQWGNEEKLLTPVLYDSFRGGTQENIDEYEGVWTRSLQFALPQMCENRLSEISLCIREGLINALLHGTRGRPELKAHLRVFKLPGRDELQVVIEDEGTGYDVSGRNDSNEPDETGHISFGLKIMESYSSKLERDCDGSVLRMSFPFENKAG